LPFDLGDFVGGDALVHGKFDGGINPRLCLTVRRQHVDMPPRFFPREENNPEMPILEYSRAQ